MGLRQHAEDDPHGSRSGWKVAQGADAGLQEWFFLRARSGNRRTAVGEELCLRQLDQGYRPEDGTSDPEPGRGLRKEAEAGVPGELGCSQLAAHVLRSA